MICRPDRGLLLPTCAATAPSPITMARLQPRAPSTGTGALVRKAVAEHRGAEIKNRGQSSTSSDLRECRCSMRSRDPDVVHGSERNQPGAPIAVGIGAHAGETVENGDGHLGTRRERGRRSRALPRRRALVSDTVRILTASVLPVRYVSRGRQQLKGIPEPVAVYRAQRGEFSSATAPSRLRSARFRGCCHRCDHVAGSRQSRLARFRSARHPAAELLGGGQQPIATANRATAARCFVSSPAEGRRPRACYICHEAVSAVSRHVRARGLVGVTGIAGLLPIAADEPARRSIDIPQGSSRIE